MNTTNDDDIGIEKRRAAFRKLVEELQVRHADGTIKAGADVKRLLGKFTASLWPAMKPQAAQTPAKRTLTDIAARYYGGQKRQQATRNAAPARQRQQPQPESAERPEATTSIDADAIYAKWNSPKKAGALGGVKMAPITRGR